MIQYGKIKGSLAIIVLWVFFFILKIGCSPQTLDMFSGSNTITMTNCYLLLSCAFLHQNFLHLILNVLTLCYVGSLLEPILKSKVYMIVFIMGVLMTSCFATLVLNANDYLGGSLGIFALIGYLSMGWLKQAIPFHK